ncbi:DUF294 nucleotidyltransferase-like domain-containing protein [Salipaludibacillus neizhouensis]|nr:DUF294 nucleotidyltransferase-like domain-containing protein [Salipaludibacillus neizhouensis]
MINKNHLPTATYEDLRAWRNEMIQEKKSDHANLNQFHDELMKEIISLSQNIVESEWGSPPAPFTFILMGSGGRQEQAIWSDQDHGIIFDGNKEHADYFLKLGEEIVKGMEICGYELCEGKVMANNPRWCKSSDVWESQLLGWLEDRGWESLRNVSIFYDSRALVGERSLLTKTKNKGFEKMKENPDILSRLADNVQYIKKGIGLFGQLLPETKGENKGKLDVKEVVLFPYINAIRLLSFLEKIQEAPTLERFDHLSDNYTAIKTYKRPFSDALDLRLKVNQDVKNYESVHFIPLNSLSKKEYEALKSWIKDGSSLMREATNIIKRNSKESEKS